MTVGPEMAGNVIELTTDTPGITITPASQIVPPGGGVLAWTISGASAGDVIHLVAVGIESYAGPEEGVGLCCTQEIEIVIPEDLDCPDEEGRPDIRIDKRADDASCTREGPCDFTIRATNVGDAPYTGKIVLDEVTTPGNAAVITGPNAPWSCPPMVSPMSCEHPEVTLNPGEFVELKLGFQPGPGWVWSAIRNCAEYDYTASGKEPFGDPTNDKACASIPICIPGVDRECTPPEDENPDIGVRKRADPVNCTADGLCTFVIDVINMGSTTIDGPLTVIDEFPVHPPVSATFQPAPWSCVPESGIRFTATIPASRWFRARRPRSSSRRWSQTTRRTRSRTVPRSKPCRAKPTSQQQVLREGGDPRSKRRAEHSRREDRRGTVRRRRALHLRDHHLECRSGDFSGTSNSATPCRSRVWCREHPDQRRDAAVRLHARTDGPAVHRDQPDPGAGEPVASGNGDDTGGRLAGGRCSERFSGRNCFAVVEPGTRVLRERETDGAKPLTVIPAPKAGPMTATSSPSWRRKKRSRSAIRASS